MQLNTPAIILRKTQLNMFLIPHFIGHILNAKRQLIIRQLIQNHANLPQINLINFRRRKLLQDLAKALLNHSLVLLDDGDGVEGLTA
jgi:hypothetical protein